MKIGVFWGCRILTSQYAYEMSIREVLPNFGIKVVDLPENLCCGDPVKSISDFAANYLAARTLAVANSMGLQDLLVPCNRCHFAVSEARDVVEKNGKQGQRIVDLLKEEGLEYSSSIKVWHVLDFLHGHVGLDSIKKTITKPFKDLKLASHTGCQLIRYSDLGRPDDAEVPQRLDELIGALGAESVDYAEKLDCCGAALMYSHADSALSLSGSKIKALQSLGVDALVVSCPDCGMMFDSKQEEASATVGVRLNLPVVYYTQLLGLALGIGQDKLGLYLNQSPVDQLLSKLSS